MCQKTSPYVPIAEAIDKHYKAVWKSKHMKYVVIIKTILYTGARVLKLLDKN